MSFPALSTLLISIVFQSTQGERLLPTPISVSVEVPTFVKTGDSAVLHCNYDLNGEQLYTLKWFKGRFEFFSCTPDDSPPFSSYPIEGFNVDVRNSNCTELTLTKIRLNGTDDYTCKVITDYPHYNVAQNVSRMTVIAVPKRKPEIFLTTNAYLGKPFSAYCTSYISKPAANLTWFLNGLPINASYLSWKEMDRDAKGRESVTLWIHFVPLPEHFIDSWMTLTCEATISPNLYFGSSGDARVRLRVLSNPSTTTTPKTHVATIDKRDHDHNHSHGKSKPKADDCGGCHTKVLVPERKPYIYVQTYAYYKKPFTAKCIAPKTMPRANLTWTMNGLPARREYVGDVQTFRDRKGEEAVSLSLHFVARLEHFVSHWMNLRCKATVEHPRKKVAMSDDTQVRLNF